MSGVDINELLLWMVESRSSDLHLSLESRPTFRRNGTLGAPGAPRDLPPITRDDLANVLEAVATPGELQRLSLERELDKALDIDGVGRFRLNVAFARGDLCFAFRRVSSEIPSITEIGLPAVCERLSALPRGLVLATGPTGSGKSTTLAAMIDRINQREARHVVTVEDPIEYVHRNKRSIINQREVGADTRSFADALRRVLRQDPDVILIGEMRDLETMSAAITAAETGHLVLATLHTPDAPQTIDRIIDAYPGPQQSQVRAQLSMVIEAVISQALLPNAEGTGLALACEVMLGTPAIRNLIREGKTPQIAATMATGSQQEMRTLDQSLADLARRGVITRETAQRYAGNPGELDRLLGPSSLVA